MSSAVALGIDPVELRLRTSRSHDESGLPFSEHARRGRYQVGAERFGWSTESGAALDGDGGCYRLGMATATYPMYCVPASPAALLVALMASPRLRVPANDMGPGTWTVNDQVAADALGLPLEAGEIRAARQRCPGRPRMAAR